MSFEPQGKSFDKVIEFIEQKQLLSDCGSVVVGFSGGADSVVLLHILSIYCKRNGTRLHAFHVHHGIRGATADRDLEFCKSFCKQLGVDFGYARIDVPSAAAKQKRGLEEVARDMRYDCLEKYRVEKGIGRIAVAHHADDNLETLIFNIVRGSGSKGGCGIAPIRGRIIRPLLPLTKDEILCYAEQNGLGYVTDETNLDEAYTRNFIRGQILPLLKKINPSASDAALRFCRSQRADCDYIESCAETYKDTDSIKELSELHDAILYRLIGDRFRRISGGESLSAVHLDALCSLIRKGKSGSRTDLPCRISAVIKNEKLVFEKTDIIGTDDRGYRIRLHCGENYIPQADAYICIWKNIGDAEEKSIKEKQFIYKLAIHKTFRSDRICSDDLFARSRADGDRIRFGNMTRKVKKLFCDGKIPIETRKILPIITDGSEILWIPGFPARDGTTDDISCGDDISIYCFMNRNTEKSIESRPNKNENGGIYEGKL